MLQAVVLCDPDRDDAGVMRQHLAGCRRMLGQFYLVAAHARVSQERAGARSVGRTVEMARWLCCVEVHDAHGADNEAEILAQFVAAQPAELTLDAGPELFSIPDAEVPSAIHLGDEIGNGIAALVNGKAGHPRRHADVPDAGIELVYIHGSVGPSSPRRRR